jgi:hypothetical protein
LRCGATLYFSPYSEEYNETRTRLEGPMQQLDHVDFPIVAHLGGGVTDDGQAVLVQILTSDGTPIHFCLKQIDLEKFLTFFLRITAGLQGGEPVQDRTQYQPIPISGVSAGELADGMGCLGVVVGGTELMFQMPREKLTEFGQSLLLAGAAADRGRMS